MNKSNRKFKILYKYIRANTSAIWQNMLQIPPTKIFLTAQTKKDKSHTKEHTFRKMGV